MLKSVAVLVAIGAFFLIANRGAYQGYFADDELQNVSLTRDVAPSVAPLALLWPRYYTNNFRPIGHLYYRALAATAGLTYGPYVATLHALHLLNVVLLWFILRRLGLPFAATVMGVLFFAFHMAVFDVYWRPAYVFDLLSGTFCLAAILCWVEDRWILSLLAFWLAYRSKEIAVLLPAALAAYEWLLGKRRWKPLVPFFVLSLWMGIQGLWSMSHASGEAYALHSGLTDLGKSLAFYSSSIFLAPRGGLLLLAGLLALVALLKDRRAWFSVILAALLIAPMLLLSERLSGAYLYVPLIGVAITIAALASRPRAAVAMAICFALWIPWNYVNLRRLRRAELGAADDRRQYIATLTNTIQRNPDLESFVYEGGPLLFWGVGSAIHWLRPQGFTLQPEESDLGKLWEKTAAVLYWDRTARKLQPLIRTPTTPDVEYIRMNSQVPLWQLGTGWLPGENEAHRWTRPHATARLRRPAGANEFELIVNIGPAYIQSVKRSHVDVRINGQLIGQADFDQLGFQTVHWNLDPAPPGEVEVTFDTSPAYFPGPLGSAIVAFGFR